MDEFCICEEDPLTEDEKDDYAPEDVFGMALTNETWSGENVIDSENAPSLEELEVTYLQWKAARHMLTCGASLRGLSVRDTSGFLKSHMRDGDFKQKWGSARAFWNDHRVRQSAIPPTIGQWKTYEMRPTKPEISVHIAYIRDIKATIKHVIESAQHLRYVNGYSGPIDWSRHLQLQSNNQYDKDQNRILTDCYSGDVFIYVESAILLDEPNRSVTSVPVQLFIDKANVTRLNKRSMYPVVLYVLCFSRSIRRAMGVNVAFIPFVSKFSTTGGHLADTIVKLTRNSVLQTTIGALLAPIRRDTVFPVTFPDGVRRRARPLLLSLVMDLPEAAVCASRRFRVSTRFNCPRCFVPTEQFGDLDHDESNFKSAQEIMALYDSISKQRLKGQQEKDLQDLSLRLPRSTLLERYESNLDTPPIKMRLPHSMRAAPFSYHPIMKFEEMHNFDLGITKDTLESIPKFLATALGASQSTKIVGVANSHQAALPRRSQTGMFRMPALGTAIAASHANLTAQNYFSVLSVLPFLLRGSGRGFSGGSKATFQLIRFFLSYLDLHNFVRRVNWLPWHIYDTVETQLKEKMRSMSAEYSATFGRISGNGSPTVLRTPKAHQLFFHLVRDIKDAGIVQEYDAQSGESHHVGTRAHYQRSSRRKDAEREVALRATTREVGVLREMYPLCEGEEGIDAESPVDSSDSSEEEDVSRPIRKKRQSFQTLTAALNGEVSEERFQILLQDWCADNVYRYRSHIRKVRVDRTLKMSARYPWIEDSGETHPSLEFMKGLTQKVRAARSFYGPEPQFDFVELFWEGELWMGQIRLLFHQPYSDKMLSDPILCLIRLLEKDLPRADVCGSDETYWEQRTKGLLASHGCDYYRWCLEGDGSIRRVITSSKNILRPVGITPDFSCPFKPEVRSKFWDLQTDRGQGTSSLADPAAERFFYNTFMPWTAP